jgi:predicted nuclease of predicted toxin-antitoxin system
MFKAVGVDVLSAYDAASIGQTDESQLAFAASAGRVLVSFDMDFLILHQSGCQHAGILWTPLTKHSIGGLIQALLLVHGAMTSEEMLNHLEHL